MQLCVALWPGLSSTQSNQLSRVNRARTVQKSTICAISRPTPTFPLLCHCHSPCAFISIESEHRTTCFTIQSVGDVSEECAPVLAAVLAWRCVHSCGRSPSTAPLAPASSSSAARHVVMRSAPPSTAHASKRRTVPAEAPSGSPRPLSPSSSSFPASSGSSPLRDASLAVQRRVVLVKERSEQAQQDPYESVSPLLSDLHCSAVRWAALC